MIAAEPLGRARPWEARNDCSSNGLPHRPQPIELLELELQCLLKNFKLLLEATDFTTPCLKVHSFDAPTSTHVADGLPRLGKGRSDAGPFPRVGDLKKKRCPGAWRSIAPT